MILASSLTLISISLGLTTNSAYVTFVVVTTGLSSVVAAVVSAGLFTVTVTLSFCPEPSETVITDIPGLRPITFPFEPTIATSSSLDTNV